MMQNHHEHDDYEKKRAKTLRLERMEGCWWWGGEKDECKIEAERDTAQRVHSFAFGTQPARALKGLSLG